MADTPNEATVIGNDIHIQGEMTFQKTVRLTGTFEGTIHGKGELQVSKGAACKADVDAAAVIVDGVVEGNVVASDKIQLNGTGVVRGDIVAGKMIMTEGASFFGQCSVGPEAVKNAGGKAPAAASPTQGAPAAKGADDRPKVASAAK